MYSSTNIVPGLVGRRADGMKISVLMVVDNFNLLCSWIRPDKTNSVAFVHPNTKLPDSAALKSLEAISGRQAQIKQSAGIQY